MEKMQYSFSLLPEKKAVEEIRRLAKSKKDDKKCEYQGWAMIYAGELWEWIKLDFFGTREILERNGIKLLRWSSLTGDPYNHDEFGVKIV